MNKQLNVLVTVICLCSNQLCFSQYHFPLSTESVSARVLSLGNAGTAYNSDGSCFQTNCSGVAYQKSTILSGTYTSAYGSLSKPLSNSFWVGVIIPYQPFSFACNWVRSSSSDVHSSPDLFSLSFSEREKKLNQGTVFSFVPQMNDAVTISIAKQNIITLDWGWNQYSMPIEIPVGINVRYAYSTINNLTGSGIAFDVGGSLKINLRDMAYDDNYPKISLGWMLRNIGGMNLHWSNNNSDYTYYQHSFGMAIEQPLSILESHVNILYDTRSEYGGSNNLGIEWTYRKYLSVRCGVSSSNFTTGIGVDLDFFNVDYGYKYGSYEVLGNVHRLTCAFRLEKLL